jgi:hypothetical protein
VKALITPMKIIDTTTKSIYWLLDHCCADLGASVVVSAAIMARQKDLNLIPSSKINA